MASDWETVALLYIDTVANVISSSSSRSTQCSWSQVSAYSGYLRLPSDVTQMSVANPHRPIPLLVLIQSSSSHRAQTPTSSYPHFRPWIFKFWSHIYLPDPNLVIVHEDFVIGVLSTRTMLTINVSVTSSHGTRTIFCTRTISCP